MISKKAVAPEKMIFYLGFGVFYTIIFFILIILISSFISTSIAIPEDVELFIYSQRFLDSPNCFTYEDSDTGRSFAGVIDINKFTNKTLKNCYYVFVEEDEFGEKKDSTTAPPDATSVIIPKHIPQKNLGFRLTLITEDIKRSIQTSNWVGKTRKVIVKDIFIMQEDTMGMGKLSIELQDVI